MQECGVLSGGTFGMAFGCLIHSASCRMVVALQTMSSVCVCVVLDLKWESDGEASTILYQFCVESQMVAYIALFHGAKYNSFFLEAMHGFYFGA